MHLRFGLLIASATLVCASQPASAAPVSAFLSGNDRTVGHGAVRVSDFMYYGSESSFSIHYNSQPVLPPYQNPNPGASRFSPNHPKSNFVRVIYSKLTGEGAFNLVQSEDTPFVHGLPFGTAAFGAPGAYPPVLAHDGVLPSELSLPDGTTIPAGATIYSDFSNLVLNVNAPSDYWFDGPNNLERRIYRGGNWAFFHKPAASYVKFAEYRSVTVAVAINWNTGQVDATWTGTPVGVNGVILPASGVANSSDPLDVDAIIDNEIASPYTGEIGRFPGSFTITFHQDEAFQDGTNPTCRAGAVQTRAGGQVYLPVFVSDGQSGVARVQLTGNSTNCVLEWDGPEGTVTVGIGGTIQIEPVAAEVTVRAVKLNSSQRARVELRVWDAAGNTVVCDPVIAQLEIKEGKRIVRTFNGIPEHEHYVTIQNGTPGLTGAQVWVNGHRVLNNQLVAGQVVTLDVHHWMRARKNSVRVVAEGTRGATAILLIGDASPSSASAVSGRANREFAH